MVQHITRQYGAVQNSMVLHITVYYSTLWYSKIQYNIGGTVHYTMVEYNVPWSGTIQYFNDLCHTVWCGTILYFNDLCHTVSRGTILCYNSHYDYGYRHNDKRNCFDNKAVFILIVIEVNYHEIVNYIDFCQWSHY